MELTIGEESFGIDVKLIREIMTAQTVTPAALSHPMVKRLVKPQDIMYTVIDLPSFIKNEKLDKNLKDLFIYFIQFYGFKYRFSSQHGKRDCEVDTEGVQQPE